MKVLWIVNTIFPYPSKQMNIENTIYGGWLVSLFEELNKNSNVEFAIATTYCGNKLLKYKTNNTVYYLLPCNDATKYDENLLKYWQTIVEEFKPVLIHIHGSEYVHSLPLLRNIGKKIPTVLSIQGLIHKIAEVYDANISKKIINRNITFRDIVKSDSILNQREKFVQRGIYEKEIISRVGAIIGRTEWDKSCSKELNNTIKYYKNNESLRQSFYENNWDISKIERNTIFCSQASYPIKGLHFMLEALNELKKEIPNIKLKVAGYNILNDETLKDKLKTTGYAKYLKKLIKKYDLKDNVIFTGPLCEQEMCKAYLEANVFVQTSVIENSPNSLGEAMLLGVPCVASNVGGTRDMLLNNIEGLLYQYDDISTLCEHILKILRDDETAVVLGKRAQMHAKETHNKENNVKELLKIYNQIIKENKI